MARYVLVAAEGFDKNIMNGPFDVDDPSLLAVPEGQRLMTEEEAFAEGYHYAEGGAGFAADQPAGADTAVQDSSAQGDEDSAPAQDGNGEAGVQGEEGGQGSQVQPGGQDPQ